MGNTKKNNINSSNYFKTINNKLSFQNAKYGNVTLTFQTTDNVMSKHNFNIEVDDPYNLSGLLSDEYLLETMEIDSLENISLLKGKVGKNPVLSTLIKV